MRLIEDRNMEVKELWTMIQKLGYANEELKYQSQKSTRIQKETKHKTINLKISIPNGNPEDIFVSNSTIDWKMKMRQDLRKLSDRRKRNERLNKKFERLGLEKTRKMKTKFVRNKQKSSTKSKYVSKLQHVDRFAMKRTGSVKSTEKVDKVTRKDFDN